MSLTQRQEEELLELLHEMRVRIPLQEKENELIWAAIESVRHTLEGKDGNNGLRSRVVSLETRIWFISAAVGTALAAMGQVLPATISALKGGGSP